jgi:dienelactone hydrolase
MTIQKNILIPGREDKPIALDIFYKDTAPRPLVIYTHGFNGFKDWGNFDIIATQFAEAGFCFVKFNFSHNGTTPEQYDELVDMDAFAKNNYTTEVDELQTVIDWVLSNANPHLAVINKEQLFLIGHSRGGGIVLLKGAEEKRVKAVASWASVAECKTPWGSWPQERLELWKQNGVDYFTNSRTGQQMPLHYQLHEDYQNNKERLNIIGATGRLKIPLLICHGTEDEPVPVSHAYALHEANKEAELFLVKSDHVFGRKHPWKENHLPEPMQEVVSKTIQFFQAIP